jgi:hypothetical protein
VGQGQRGRGAEVHHAAEGESRRRVGGEESRRGVGAINVHYTSQEIAKRTETVVYTASSCLAFVSLARHGVVRSL